MSRLAEYLSHLSTLLGQRDNVHLVQVRKGSAIPEMLVDSEAMPKIEARLHLVDTANAPEDVIREQLVINRMLREDHASATLRLKRGAVILRFAGHKTPLAEEILVHEQGSLVGTVIRVGGRDETVPVWLQSEDGRIYKCNTNRALAKELAQRLFEQPIRVAGNGKWRRDSERNWTLEEFLVKSWEILSGGTLSAAISELRAVEGSKWNSMDDPQAELKKLRGD